VEQSRCSLRVLSRPLARGVLVLLAVRLEETRDLGDERVVGVRVGQQRADRQQHYTTHNNTHTYIHRTTGTVAQWHSQVLLWGWDYTRLYSHPSHTVHLSYQLKEHPIIHQLFYTLFYFYIAYMVHLRKRNDCKNKKMIKTKRIQD